MPPSAIDSERVVSIAPVVFPKEGGNTFEPGHRIELRAVVAYGSRFGNTERVAKALAEGLRHAQGLEVLCADISSLRPGEIEHSDFVAIGAPTEWGSAPASMKQFLSQLNGLGLQGKPIFAFDTRYRSPVSGSAAKVIERSLEGMGAAPLRPRASAFVRQAGAKGGGQQRDLLLPGMLDRFEALGKEIGEALVAHARDGPTISVGGPLLPEVGLQAV